MGKIYSKYSIPVSRASSPYFLKSMRDKSAKQRFFTVAHEHFLSEEHSAHICVNTEVKISSEKIFAFGKVWPSLQLFCVN